MNTAGDHGSDDAEWLDESGVSAEMETNAIREIPRLLPGAGGMESPGITTTDIGGDMRMRGWFFRGLIVWLILATGPAWALSDGDLGSLWIQAPTNQKIQVVNILSRELKLDPGKLQQCLDKIFADPVNEGKTILDAARECKAQP
jgi:hypothetical protein